MELFSHYVVFCEYCVETTIGICLVAPEKKTVSKIPFTSYTLH